MPADVRILPHPPHAPPLDPQLRSGGVSHELRNTSRSQLRILRHHSGRWGTRDDTTHEDRTSLLLLGLIALSAAAGAQQPRGARHRERDGHPHGPRAHGGGSDGDRAWRSHRGARARRVGDGAAGRPADRRPRQVPDPDALRDARAHPAGERHRCGDGARAHPLRGQRDRHGPRHARRPEAPALARPREPRRDPQPLDLHFRPIVQRLQCVRASRSRCRW